MSVGEEPRDEPGGLGLAHLVVSGQQYDERFDVVDALVRPTINRADKSWLSAYAHKAGARSLPTGVIDEAEAPRRHHRAPGQRGPFLDDDLRSRVGVRVRVAAERCRQRRDAVVRQPQR